MKELLFLLIGLNFQTGLSQQEEIRDFKKYFNKYKVNGCFVLYNQAADKFIRYNKNYCDTGYIPASTFKIPNSVIAIEEGIIKDTSQIIKWDGHEWPNKVWNQDQTLKTAMKFSCIWVYFDIAKQVGIDTYYSYVKSFNYGNKNLTGSPERFWLAGLLRISANQQIDFLQKFYNYELEVSNRSIDIVKDIIIIEKEKEYKLSGKTGGGVIPDDKYIMWLVGYLEKEEKVYFYAMNFIAEDYDKTSRARLEITKSILRELKLIEE